MDWISVKDRLPDDSGLYLVAYNNNGGLSIEISLLTHHERKFTSSWDSGQFHDLVTHWMPLPKLPKEGK